HAARRHHPRASRSRLRRLAVEDGHGRRDDGGADPRAHAGRGRVAPRHPDRRRRDPPDRPVSTPQPPDPHAGGMPPLPPVPAPPAGVESLADGEWHRLHPLTPLFKGGLVLIIVAGILLNSF